MAEDHFELIDQRDQEQRPEATLILSCYNQAKAIQSVLDSLMNQTFKNFEICIADDGSKDQSREVILRYPVCYVRQENRGFRKTRILNEAIRQMRSDYIILLDGDCVPHSEFIEGHMDLREEGYFLAGRRIDLDEDLTNSFFQSNLSIDQFIRRNLLKIEKLNRALIIRNPFLRKLFKQDRVEDMMGCNASFWKKDFLSVDGFDESFEGYFREDGDLDVRFRHAGLQIKSVKSRSLIFHLWHPRRSDRTGNEERFQDTIQSKRVKALKGFSHREPTLR